MEEDDFQFVDFGSNESNKDIKTLREELQKLTEAWLVEHNEVKSLEKGISECRVTMGTMNEEVKQIKEEKHKMWEDIKLLEKKNEEMSLQISALKDELIQVKKNAQGSSNAGSHITCKIQENECEDSKQSPKKPILKELDKSQCYACKACGTHIALESEIISRSYQVGQGTDPEKTKGYLFNNGVNLTLGVAKTESFATGSYGISWVTCTKCSVQLGWKYLSSSNENNMSKVGKYCLARYHLTSPEERND